MSRDGAPWWREGVLYQIYPRSFADSNGDGIGDLRGIVSHLDHLEWLGVDGIWINPIMPSPNADWGYDVSDYKGVHPDYGDLSDVDDLVAQAAKRNIKVLFDLVPNHTSDQHPWFRDAASGRNSEHRDYYVWGDPKPEGGPPNNWISVFGGEPAWEFEARSRQYYLHNFLKQQPDLNWWNEHVPDAFDDILRFWLDRGVAGFRIDVCHAIIKDRELRDNVPAADDDPERIRQIGQRSEYNMNRPEVHDVLRRWRKLCDSYEDRRILVGETFVMDVESMASYYGDGNDELNLAFNFPFALSPLDPKLLSDIVETSESLIPPDGWPVWMASNHDVGRWPSRWCRNDPARIRCVLLLLMTLRGTPFLYYGDEIGMPATKIRKEDLRDPVGLRFWSERPGRDPFRTPMPWSAAEDAGFTAPGVRPWLPFGDVRACNVADQAGDPDSILSFCRELIRLRRTTPDLRRAPYRRVDASGAGWAWRRGRMLVAVNLGDDPSRVPCEGAEVVLATDRERAGRRLRGAVDLQPAEGFVAILD